MRNGLYIIGLCLALLGCGDNPDNLSDTPPTGVQTEVILSWDAPTTNEDMSLLVDLAGYKIHYGTASGVYTVTEDVALTDTPGSPEHTLTITVPLPATRYYFAITAYDTSDNESDYSNEDFKDL